MSPMTTKAPQTLPPLIVPRSAHWTDQDVYLHEGTHYGCRSWGRTWQPRAMTPACHSPYGHRMHARSRSSATSDDWKPGGASFAGAGSSGIWEGFIPGDGKALSISSISFSTQHGYTGQGRSFGVFHEKPPRTASVVCGIWTIPGLNGEWDGAAGQAANCAGPISVTRCTWAPDAPARRKRAPPELPRDRARLAEYIERLGFTPRPNFCPSWSIPSMLRGVYQTTGYFRADRPLRHASGFHVSGGLSPSAWYWE